MTSLIITIFDRETFDSNTDYFDNFNKLFENLGNNVKYINIKQNENVIEKIKKNYIKPNFVFLYCCCRGGVIDGNDVIQAGKNSDLISVDAIINIATDRDSKIPVFIILECGREIYQYKYFMIENCVRYEYITRYYLTSLGSNIRVGNRKFQDLLYKRLIDIDNFSYDDICNDALISLRKEVNKSGYDYRLIRGPSDSTANMHFIKLFVKKTK